MRKGQHRRSRRQHGFRHELNERRAFGRYVIDSALKLFFYTTGGAAVGINLYRYFNM